MLIVPRRLLLATMCSLATAAGALGVPVAPALADTADAATTQAYIRANYALVHAAADNIASAEAGIAGLVAQVRRECPNAASKSPQDYDSEQLSDEVVGAIVVAGIRPNLAAIQSFIRATGHVRWSSARLTNTVRAYTAKLKALAALTAPNVCSDVQVWAAGGYQTLPASTVRFDAQYTPVWVALGEVPAALHSFEGSGDGALVRASSRLENEITEYEARAVNTYAEILDALELKQ